MPEVAGFEVLAWIRDQGSALNVPVIALTASPSERDMERADGLVSPPLHSPADEPDVC